MAKITTSDKHGSVGPSTFQRTRHGVIERVRGQQVDPQTTRQLEHRKLVQEVAGQWRHLAEEARPGWMTLGNQLRRPLTGQQLYCKVNFTLLVCGLPGRETAPPVPVFGQLTCGGLRVEDGPLVKLLQVSDTAGADRLVIEACAPVHRGISYVANRFRFLTAVPAPAGAAADLDLTAAYTARFLAPRAGQRLFLRITAMTSGFKGVPVQVSGLVQAHAG